MYKLLQSSANPNKLATTVKGILMGLVPLIVIVLSVLGFEIGTEQITEVIVRITALIAGAFTLCGMGRKLYYFIKTLIKK